MDDDMRQLYMGDDEDEDSSGAGGLLSSHTAGLAKGIVVGLLKKILLNPVVLIILAIVLVFVIFVFLLMGAEGSFSDGVDEAVERKNKITITGDEEEFWYNPQNVLDNLDTLNESIDVSAVGHSNMTEDDLKLLLNSIIAYRNLVRKNVQRSYTYYKHHYDWEANPDYNASGSSSSTTSGSGSSTTSGGGTSTATSTTNTTDPYLVTDEESYTEPGLCTNSSIEDDPLFAVSWEEIYAIIAMDSMIEDGEIDLTKWENEDGKDGKEIVATKRLDPEKLQTLINSFTYEFGYYFDPTDAKWNGTVFKYKEMENYAYIPRVVGTNVKHGTEVAGQTPPFTYEHYKIPAVAPAYAKNSYQTVDYIYEGNVLKGRMITVDGAAFADLMEELMGEGNFDFDWFMDKLRLLPGVNYELKEGRGSVLSRYERLYQSYLNDSPDVYWETSNVPGVGSVRLGSACDTAQIAVNQINLQIDDKGKISGGVGVTYKANWTPSHKEFIDTIAKAAMEAYKEYPILVSITVAQAILESGWGSRSIGNNIFGVKAGSSWTGKKQLVDTHEVANGVRYATQDWFRDYDSIEDSIADHNRLLGTSSYYEGIPGNMDYKDVAVRLTGVYATDEHYAEKLIGIIDAYDLDVYDKMVGP